MNLKLFYCILDINVLLLNTPPKRVLWLVKFNPTRLACNDGYK